MLTLTINGRWFKFSVAHNYNHNRFVSHVLNIQTKVFVPHMNMKYVLHYNTSPYRCVKSTTHKNRHSQQCTYFPTL